ncbi:MAG: hypothetical protein V3T33_04855 [Myxococcota bacterium]
MLKGLQYGLQLALRTGVAPLLMGLRWAQRREEMRGVPRARWNLKLVGKIALDEFFFATELTSGTLLSLRDHERVSEEVSEALDLYAALGWLDAPASFHLTPPPLEDAKLEAVASRWLPYQHLRFTSGYEPHPGEPGRERWLQLENNRVAHAWLLEHPGPTRPWLVCVPGYRMGNPTFDFAGFRARWLHRELGLNIAIPVLPLHGPRAVGRRSGDGFFSGDFLDTIHAQAQAVWDVRRLLAWLRERDVPGLGIYGVSLGGYTAALVAGLEEELDCVIAGIPASDFLRLMRNHIPPLLLRRVERAGFRFAEVETLLSVVSPLAIPRRVARSRCYLYAGIADRLASPDQARDLWKHWGRPRLTWYPGGHVSFLWEPAVEASLREALGQSGLVPSLLEG